MMTFWSQLGNFRPVFNPEILRLVDDQSWDIGIENAAGIPGLQFSVLLCYHEWVWWLRLLWRCCWIIFRNYCLQCFDTVGWRQEEHLACKNWVMGCWFSNLSGARCRLFAHGLADATAIRLLPHLNPDWFYFSGTGLATLSWKRGGR